MECYEFRSEGFVERSRLGKLVRIQPAEKRGV